MARARGRWLVASVSILAVWTSAAWCGTTGTLTGKIVDEKKQPLAGVNVRLPAQRLGGVSDDQGNFTIVGIPAGDVSVQANLLGHTPYVADRVTIRPDFTTTLNITLST